MAGGGGVCAWGGVQFALSQSPGLEAMMIFRNNDAGTTNNRQGALYVSRIDKKKKKEKNYQSSLGKSAGYVQKPLLAPAVTERLLGLSSSKEFLKRKHPSVKIKTNNRLKLCMT